MRTNGDSGRLRGLDGLRAVAIAGVIGIHSGFAAGGHLGVSVFFVLSGYLITLILARQVLSSGHLHFRAFYQRRIVRLVPALVTALLGTVLVTLGSAPMRDIAAGVAAAFTYTSNLFLMAGVDGHTHLANFVWPWTLAMEEQFYLLWPVALMLHMRRGLRTAEAAAAVGFFVSTALRFVVPVDGPAEPAQLYFGPHTRASGLMLGCWLALRLLRKGSPLRVNEKTVNALLIAAMTFVVLAYQFGGLFSRATYTFWLTGTELSTAALIAVVVTTPDSRGVRLLAWAPLAYLGRISYGIYLWNVAAITLVDRVLEPTGRVVPLLEWGSITLLIAGASFRWLEAPLIERLRRKQASSPVLEARAAP